MKWLNGKKTYIGMIAGGVIGFAVSMGWVSWEQVQPYAAIVGTWTGVAMTHKASKLTG